MLVAVVVLEAVAGLALLEASPVFPSPLDHSSTFYERDQAKVAYLACGLKVDALSVDN